MLLFSREKFVTMVQLVSITALRIFVVNFIPAGFLPFGFLLSCLIDLVMTKAVLTCVSSTMGTKERGALEVPYLLKTIVIYKKQACTSNPHKYCNHIIIL